MGLIASLNLPYKHRGNLTQRCHRLPSRFREQQKTCYGVVVYAEKPESGEVW